MAKMNWGKIENERKLNYRPAQSVRPASQKQIDFINGLAVQKGQRRPKIPKTMRGASELIERLLKLPDVTERIDFEPIEAPPEAVTVRKQLVADLQDAYPALTPMTVNSFIQLAEVASDDPLGVALFVNEVVDDAEYAPEALSDLIAWLMRRFIAFSAC